MRIQRRLLIVFTVLLGAVLLASTFTLSRWVSSVAESQLRESLGREASALAAEYERARPAEASAWAHDHEVRTGTRVTLVAPNGAVLADSGPLGVEPGRREDVQRRELRAAFACTIGEARRDGGSDGILMVLAVPVGKDPCNAMVVARPLASVEMVVGRAQSAVAAACGVAFAFAILLSWMLARWLARSLSAMTRAARAMARGEFELALPPPPDDELGDLSRALSLLRGQLAARIAELRAEGQKLKTILDGMAEGVALVQRGRITVANRPFSRLLCATDEVEGRTPLEAARVPELDEIISGALAAGTPAQCEVQVGARPLSMQALPLGERGSEQAVLVISDLSEPRRLERLRRDLVANASHELRTPVAAIVGVAETLSEGAADDPEARASFIDILLRHAHRLANLTRDLLDLSRLEAGYRPRVEAVSVSAVVDSVLSTLGPRAAEKTQTLSHKIEANLAVAADRAAVEQILTNLVDNAIKYTPASGRITVRAEAKRDIVDIVVEDTGPGISAEHQHRIFERFYRVDEARSRELGGTGLGLAIVKHLTLANGGEVSVESKVGEGSRFHVRLPRATLAVVQAAS
jgi:two-component system phosphate regulon sensor histidine kinase PhoR